MRLSNIPFLLILMVSLGCTKQPSTKLAIQRFQNGNTLISNYKSDHIRIKDRLPVLIGGNEIGSVCPIPWGFEYHDISSNRVVPLIKYSDYSESIAIVQSNDQQELFILWALPGVVFRPTHYLSVLNLSTLKVERKKIAGAEYTSLRNKFHK